MPSLSLAFLGSPGSFSEAAADAHARAAGSTPHLHSAPTFEALVELVREGAVERGVLAIANSSGGLVRSALDALARGGVRVVDEVELAIRLELLALPGVALATLDAVASHPQAFRQCAQNLARLLPGAARIAWSDTAGAARALAEGRLGPNTGVLASASAGQRYGLARLALDFQDEPGNRTFFAVLARDPRAGDPG